MQEDTAWVPFSISHRHKIWHADLLHKIKSCFPLDLYAIIKSYLLQRIFRVKFGEVVTQLKNINFGVPQGNVLGPLSYLLYTADLSISLDIIIATYADNTAILASHKDHIIASQRLQESLFYIQIWLKKWRIRVNGAKCAGNFHHPQKDVLFSNLEWSDDSSSWGREVFGTTSS